MEFLGAHFQKRLEEWMQLQQRFFWHLVLILDMSDVSHLHPLQEYPLGFLFCFLLAERLFAGALDLRWFFAQNIVVASKATFSAWQCLQNNTTRTQWLKVFRIYPKADFNNAWYPIMNQVHSCSSYDDSLFLHIFIDWWKRCHPWMMFQKMQSSREKQVKVQATREWVTKFCVEFIRRSTWLTWTWSSSQKKACLDDRESWSLRTELARLIKPFRFWYRCG
jgi:hypothetical protein